jgi:hypothetical protein
MYRFSLRVAEGPRARRNGFCFGLHGFRVVCRWAVCASAPWPSRRCAVGCARVLNTFSLVPCALCGFTLCASLVRQWFSIERLILRRFSGGAARSRLRRRWHYRKRSLYRELCSVPRARSKALGTGTLCREQKIELSAQKKPAVQTYCAESEQSRLSAQPTTHGTEELCRELQEWALGTAGTSRRKVTTATSVGPAIRCAESPPMASAQKSVPSA